MAIKISGILTAISLISAIFSGKLPELSEAALEGSERAVTLVISLIGIMCLWSGIMRAAERAGVLEFISKAIRPILRLAFPEAVKNGRGTDEISAAVTANLLGIGNAGTPLAVNAVKKLTDGSDTATNELVTFTVLGTAFPSLFPTTVIAIRAAAGSKEPMCILPAVWMTSVCLSAFAVLICRIIGRKKIE